MTSASRRVFNPQRDVTALYGRSPPDMSFVNLHVYDVVSDHFDSGIPYVHTINAIGRNVLGLGGVFHSGIVRDATPRNSAPT